MQTMQYQEMLSLSKHYQMNWSVKRCDNTKKDLNNNGQDCRQLSQDNE